VSFDVHVTVYRRRSEKVRDFRHHCEYMKLHGGSDVCSFPHLILFLLCDFLEREVSQTQIYCHSTIIPHAECPENVDKHNLGNDQRFCQQRLNCGVSIY
jgi:hypothetical protein